MHSSLDSLALSLLSYLFFSLSFCPSRFEQLVQSNADDEGEEAGAGMKKKIAIGPDYEMRDTPWVSSP